MTTLSRLPDGRWLVTRQGVASHHPTLAAACIEAGWEGDLPAQRAPSPRSSLWERELAAARDGGPPTTHLLHRPGSLTHPWVLTCLRDGSQVGHADLPSALGALAAAVERGHRPHIGPAALAEIIDATEHLISPYPSLPTLRALAAIARPKPLDPSSYLPHGIPADLSHPTEPQSP